MQKVDVYGGGNVEKVQTLSARAKTPETCDQAQSKSVAGAA
jgi:hypothetical protein